MPGMRAASVRLPCTNSSACRIYCFSSRFQRRRRGGCGRQKYAHAQLAQLLWQMLDVEHFALRERGAGLDEIGQLAPIAWVIVFDEFLHRLRPDFLERTVHRHGEFAQQK